MDIRLATQQDLPEIETLCKEFNFPIPTAETILIAVEDNKIIGLLGLQHVIKIEPLITQSNFAAHSLYYSAMGILINQGVQRVECFSTDQHLKCNQNLFERLGFKFIEKTNRFIKHLL